MQVPFLTGRLQRLPENVRWMLAGFVVIGTLCLGNYSLVSGRSAPVFDAMEYFGPEFSLVADHIKAGRLLLWDPWVAGGTPDSAEPELGSYSPIVLAFGLLAPNPWAGFVLYWMTIWNIGAIGVLVLCRHLKCPVWGAIVAALGFAASGFYTGHAEYTAHLYSVSFLPWVLWRADLAFVRRSLWYAVQAGVIYGVSALGGYPLYTIVTPAFLGLWAIGRIVDENVGNASWPQRRNQLLFSASAILVLATVGAAVMSPAYVGFSVDNRGYSDHIGPRSREEAIADHAFPAGELGTFASPYLSLPDIRYGRYWPFNDVSMRSIYMGCLVTSLAFFSLTGRSKWRWSLFLIAAFFLCCALGYQTPIRGWLYDYFPATRYFRNAACLRAYVMLLFALLAALGARELSSAAEADDGKRLSWFVIVCALLAILSGYVFAVVVHLSKYAIYQITHPIPEQVIESRFWPAVALAGIIWSAITLLSYLLSQRKLSRTAIYGLLIATAFCDAVATLYIASPTMYSASTVSFWHEMDREHKSNLDLSANGLWRQLEPPVKLTFGPDSPYHSNKNLPPKVATVLNDSILKNHFYRQIADNISLRKMALGEDRTWFTPDATWVPASDAEFLAYEHQAAQMGKPVAVLHSREQMLDISRNQISLQNGLPVLAANEVRPLSPARVSQVIYKPNALSFHYLAPTGGWLVVTDRWAPGWTAKVNGRSEEVLGANFVYRAVRVETGDNFVQFRYRPWGWPFLLILSWGTLLVVGIGQIMISVRRYRKREERQTLKPQ